MLHGSQSEKQRRNEEPAERGADELLDGFLAIVLLILSIPFLALAAIMVKVADRGDVFWKGERLGQYKVPFVMYKFRTLTEGAETLIGGRPFTRFVAEYSGLQHRFGEFLRNSRLDELPQLINVIRGDMRLIGPRPIRRELYEAECRIIPDYERRFAVKPGLVGYSQVLTPASCDRRIRKKIDNRFVSKKPSLPRQLLFLFCVLFVLVLRLPGELVRNFRRVGGIESRRLRRVRQAHCRIRVVGENSHDGIAEDLNDDSMLVSLDAEKLFPGSVVRLSIRRFDWGCMRTKRKSAYCRVVGRDRRSQHGSEASKSYVVNFEPVSPLNYYVLHKYFLRHTLL